MTANLPAAEIRIHYCRQCNWLLRAGWMAQELLNSFGDDLTRVSLEPGTGGVFRIHANDVLIWDRRRDGGFPDIAELKRRVRDVLFPQRDLGHLDSNNRGDARADKDS
jgi:selenoprotein W-related protein